STSCRCRSSRYRAGTCANAALKGRASVSWCRVRSSATSKRIGSIELLSGAMRNAGRLQAAPGVHQQSLPQAAWRSVWLFLLLAEFSVLVERFDLDCRFQIVLRRRDADLLAGLEVFE